MANRKALIKKADATRLLKAARESGFSRARVIARPDGTVELVADDAAENPRDTSSDWDEVLH